MVRLTNAQSIMNYQHLHGFFSIVIGKKYLNYFNKFNTFFYP